MFKKIVNFLFSQNKQNETFMTEFSNNENKEAYLQINKKILKNEEIFLSALKISPDIAINYLPKNLMNSKKVAMAAVQIEGDYLKHFSDSIRNNKSIVSLAVQQSGHVLTFASSSLIKDKSLAKKALIQNGGSFVYVDDALKDDKSLALLATSKNGYALAFASQRLKNDHEVVLSAVRQYGESIGYASYALKDDKEIALEAILQDPCAFRYLSSRLKGDKNIILKVAKKDSSLLYHATLKGYQSFDEIVEKEGEAFFLSCWNNKDWKTRLQVAKHHNFLPTVEQIEIGLQDHSKEVSSVYELRKDEWFGKLEELKLQSMII